MSERASGQDRVGSAAEEAAQLLAAVEQWARGRAGALLDDEHLATGSAPCQVCPLCQLVGAVRRVRPETVEHLLDAAASLVAAVRTGVAAAETAGPAPAPGVQHIDVREGEGWA